MERSDDQYIEHLQKQAAEINKDSDESKRKEVWSYGTYVSKDMMK